MRQLIKFENEVFKLGTSKVFMFADSGGGVL